MFSYSHWTHARTYSCGFDPENDNLSKQRSWHFCFLWMTSDEQYSLKIATLRFDFVSPNFYSASEKINSGWTAVCEGGGFAKRCYWSLYSWNNLYGLATAAASLINVCQKPGSGLPGVKALWNNASHHRQERQKRRNGKEGCVKVGRRGERRQRAEWERREEAKKTERLSQTFEIHKGDRSHGSRPRRKETG